MFKRIKLFSKEGKRENRNRALLGGGLIAGGLTAQTVAGDKVSKALMDEGGESRKKVLDDMIRKSGTKVSNARTNGGPAYNFMDKTVYTSGSNNPGVIAHELGHAHYDKKSTKNGIGKLAHKGYKYTGGALSHLVFAPAAGYAAGRASGKRAAKAEIEGKKESKLNRHLSWAAPLAVQGSGLIAEAAASRKGIKMMKASGASKEMIRKAKKNLGAAWATYGASAAMNAGVGELSRAHYYNKEMKKKKRE